MTDPEAGDQPAATTEAPSPAAPPAGPAPIAEAASPEAAPPEAPGEAAPGQAAPGQADPPAEKPLIKAGNEDFWVEARGSFAEGDVAGYMPSPESDQLRVSLSPFEGPLDLLLHLIEKHAVDVFDIPIKVIVAEYMKALDDMRELNLDIAGEFLVMAAQLAHIKSKMLLPREERPKEAAPELDPRAELVRRLLEYQRFKDAAARLDGLSMLGRDVFLRPGGPAQYDGPVEEPVESTKTALNLADIDLFDLIRLLDQMLKKQQKLVVHEVLVERISVGARINEMVDLLTQEARPAGYTFAELCDAFGPRDKRAVIVTFLSILEMTRLKLVRVRQDDEGHISIHPVEENLRADQLALASVDEFEKPRDETGPVETGPEETGPEETGEAAQ
jgi:segregation and condensation protein A